MSIDWRAIRKFTRKLLGRRLVEALAIVRDGYGMDEDVDVLDRAVQRLAHRSAARIGQGRCRARGKSIARARLAGLPIALATSGMRIHVDVSLGETGLAGLFDSETTGDEVTRGKPAPGSLPAGGRPPGHRPRGRGRARGLATGGRGCARCRHARNRGARPSGSRGGFSSRSGRSGRRSGPSRQLARIAGALIPTVHAGS